jgi:uncharacterized protein (DUF608 family)
VLPDNYKESSYPVAVYRWHAENPTKKRVTVSVLLSWENMLGWFRTNSRNLSGGINAGNFNRQSSEPLGAAGTMKGVISIATASERLRKHGTPSGPSRRWNPPAPKLRIRPPLLLAATGRKSGNLSARTADSRTAKMPGRAQERI